MMPDLKEVAELLQDFRAIWDAATPRERKQIVHTLLEAVYLDAERGPVVAIEPKPEYEALFRLVAGQEPGCFPGPSMSRTEPRPVGPARGNSALTQGKRP